MDKLSAFAVKKMGGEIIWKPTKFDASRQGNKTLRTLSRNKYEGMRHRRGEMSVCLLCDPGPDLTEERELEKYGYENK